MLYREFHSVSVESNYLGSVLKESGLQMHLIHFVKGTNSPDFKRSIKNIYSYLALNL